MAAIQNANVLQFICTMLRDGDVVDLTGATVTLRLQPRHNARAANRPAARIDFPAEILSELEGKVSAIYDAIDLWGKWKVQFRVVLPGSGEVLFSEPHEIEVEPNIGDETC